MPFPLPMSENPDPCPHEAHTCAEAARRLVVVDTNCFVRLYFSPLRPLLGRTVMGHRLVTLRELAEETRHRSGLTLRHPWLGSSEVQKDLSAAIVVLTPEEDQRYEEDALYYRREGDDFLERLCRSRGLESLRQLSHADAKAIAVAIDKGYALATDEWPLRAFSQFIEPDESGNPLQLFTSLELLKLFVEGGDLDAAAVRATVRQWLQNSERLPQDWPSQFRRLFASDPPDAQR